MIVFTGQVLTLSKLNKFQSYFAYKQQQHCFVLADDWLKPATQVLQLVFVF